ncbi:MAG: Uma2 family endonuclease [Acidobacteria bacterium]|nr:Uma2 family endonuclease [Acidobacteriota bacterium]
MAVQLARRHITTAEYHKMIEAGVFHEDDRLELIDGDLFEMSPIGPRHVAAVNRLNRLLSLQLADFAIISVQNPVELSEYSEPQPDLTLLKWRDDFYAQALPLPEDTLIAIEVSDTTVEKDRGLKIPAYARAGLAEAWLVDLYNDRVEIYSQPNNDVYQEIRIVLRGQDVVSKTIPQIVLKADDILG